VRSTPTQAHDQGWPACLRVARCAGPNDELAYVHGLNVPPPTREESPATKVMLSVTQHLPSITKSFSGYRGRWP
jgi:hypothetical protein